MRWRENASLLGFIVGATVLGGIGASGYRTVMRQSETALWVEHTYRVIERIDDIMLAVSTAESSVRGFALSREQYLAQDLEPQIQQAYAAYRDASSMVRDNAVQNTRMMALGPKLERRTTLLREYLQRVSAGGPTNVLPESLQLSAELRVRAQEMVHDERQLLGARVAARAQQTTQALELYGVGLGLSALIVVGAFVMMSRETRARKKTERELSQKHKETTLLLQMGELLQSTLSANEAYTVIDGCAPRFFPEEPGGIFLRAADQQSMQLRSSWGGYAASGVTQLVHDDCWALRRGRPHAYDVRGVDVRCKHSIDTQRPANSYCLPLLAHGELLGVLHVITHNILRSVEERAAIFAEHLSMALANLELRERLRDEAIRDPLTGLYNRRHTQEALERELRRASRTAEPIAVLMIDVDHFKKFNDNFGHQAGDHVLSELGKLLNANTRGSDLVSRMGGEELLIILPGAHEPDAHAKAEQLRQAVAQLNLVYEGQALGTITISLGVAMYPRHGTTQDALLRSADTALYRAKGAGRDRVVIAA